jgi:peptidoglycan/LPS O-acetylase OafA/YrhL
MSQLRVPKNRLDKMGISGASPDDRRCVAFKETRPNIPALTSLRFFAALLVLIFHYRGKNSIFPFGIANFGYEAVTFFFILSGALALPSILLNGPWIAAPLVLSTMQAWIPQFALAWNGPAWSVSNEMFFYLCYPAIYWLALRTNAVLFLCLSAALVLITTAWRDVNLASEDWHNLRAYFPLLNLP